VTLTPTQTPVPGTVFVAIPAFQSVPAFRMMHTEVTNAQYRACVTAGVCSVPGNTSSYNNPARSSHPVVFVTRAQARTYAAWMGGSLPTATQWMRACRGNDSRTYPWGETAPDASLANYNNYARDTRPVAGYPAGASPFGIHDLAGNVWEWYESDDGNQERYVVRGGAFNERGSFLACAALDSDVYWSDRSWDSVGFRVVLPGS
jgi:serine/threonine-protein kinase